ncbi:conserved protein of unknown function [Enterobacter cancerogenus]|jgi:hypothetical protein|nr:hypothetical protein ENTCAN_05610 [Enterobacter cancerogenus ATCC 35316]CAD5354470.1 conserved protein of unknown function [Enterobacter cancerogenus]
MSGACDFAYSRGMMRRIVSYLINNIREHFMLYILLWSLLALIDFIYVMFY